MMVRRHVVSGSARWAAIVRERRDTQKEASPRQEMVSSIRTSRSRAPRYSTRSGRSVRQAEVQRRGGGTGTSSGSGRG